MADVTLNEHQAALILGATDDGIQVDMAYEGEVGLAAGLCEVIARRLVEDEEFRSELLVQVQKNAAGDF